MAGALLGLLALVRENALILLPILLAWFVRGRPFGSIEEEPGLRIRTVVSFLFACALVLTPVALHNAQAGGTPLPTAANAGVNFYIGNGARADGLYVPLIPGRGHAQYERGDAKALAERDLGRQMTAAEVSGYWFERGWSDVRADPGRWCALLARKAGLLSHRAEPMDGEAMEVYLDRSATLALLARVFHFGLLLPLALVGIGTTWIERRRLWPVWLCAAGIAVSLLAFFVTARFRMGMVPFLTVFAAAGAVELVSLLATAGQRRRGLVWSAVLVLFAWVANRGVASGGDPRATTYANVASELLRRTDWEGAERWAREAVDLDDENAAACWNLGAALHASGNSAEAIGWIQSAMRLEPGLAAEGAAKLGVIHAMQGDLDVASAFLEEALRLEPNAARVHYDLGLVQRRRGRLEEAARAYLQSIRLDPGFPDAHHNLGYLRRLQGRWGEAVDHFRQALALDPDFRLSLEELALLLAASPDPRVRDGAEAERLARRVLEGGEGGEGGEGWRALDALAAAQAENGDFEAARATLERARRATDDPQVRRGLDELARSYARGYPRRLGP